MALTALQQLQNESALIQQGKIGEAVASSQSYVAAQPKVTPVVTPTSPVPVAPAVSPPAVVAKPVVSTPTISPAITPPPVAKPVVSTPVVVTPKYVTRNLSAEQKALSDILASSNIKDGTDVSTLSAATQKLLQENINNAVYGTGSPLFYGTPPPTVAPTVAPTAPAIAPAINRPVLDALIPTTPIEPTSPYFTVLPEAPQSLQEVRDDQLALAQASVDATEAYFQASLARINAIGTSNLAQTSSIAVGAGLAGSPFQQALEQGTVGATTTALGEVSAQRSSEVSNFLAQAENNAQNIYQQGVINYKNDLSFYANERDKEIAYEEAHAEAIKESGLETINNIAKSGYSLDEMPKDQYESLLANTGLSDFEARVVWSANTPEANATYTTQGNYLVQTYFDPQTKKPVVTAIPLPVELQTFETEGIDVQQIQLADGSVILYDSKHPMDENGNLRTIDYTGAGVRDIPSGTTLFGELLSVAEAETLGVPYGTTRGEAYGISTEKPLSAEMLKLQENARSGLGSLSVIRGTIGDGTRRIIANQGYKAAEANLVDVIGRLRSGGAITIDEETRFKSLLPGIRDRGTVADEKLDTLESLLRGVLQQRVGQQTVSAPSGWANDDWEYYLQNGGDPSLFPNDLSKSQNGSWGDVGSLSEKYESGGNSGAIGYDSMGGYSYGTYQLAHNNAKNFIEQSPYKLSFKGLTFNSPQWRKTWQSLAKESPKQFGQAQKDYIAKTHFEPQVAKLVKAGIDVGGLPQVIKDVIWSTAVQHGANTDVVIKALGSLAKNASLVEMLKAIYNERWSGGARFASSTPAVKKSVFNRFFGKQGELAMALQRLQNPNTG